MTEKIYWNFAAFVLQGYSFLLFVIWIGHRIFFPTGKIIIQEILSFILLSSVCLFLFKIGNQLKQNKKADGC